MEVMLIDAIIISLSCTPCSILAENADALTFGPNADVSDNAGAAVSLGPQSGSENAGAAI